MTKPWEEDWLEDCGEVWIYHGPEAEETILRRPTRAEPRKSTEAEMGRARLASCAPEMARMLLAMEAPHPGSYLCHWCGEHTQNQVPHRPNCKWLALMRKAGVRE